MTGYNMIDKDEYYMRIALAQAQEALLEDEIPVGAVLVRNGEFIATDHNRTRQEENPLAHAEHILLDRVLSNGDKFLYDYTLYVTLEPCSMCAGMLVWSRIGRIVFGCYDPKAGAVGSIYNIPKNKNFNHHPEVTCGILEKECSDIIRKFFQDKR